MKKFWKKNWFIICILIFTIIRLVLTASIPITGFPSQVYDDDLMVKMAESIRSGNWLGEYDSNTLVKGPFFPFLLALINYIGLSYINVMNIIYIMACAYFIYTIKNLFKSKISLLIIYILLIFNPVSYASWTLQRVYRNGITLAQVLFIIGSMYTLYERRNQKKYKRSYSISYNSRFGFIKFMANKRRWYMDITFCSYGNNYYNSIFNSKEQDR